MLLVGLAATPAEVEVMDGEYEARDWAAMELGRAMMLLLPALDANDRQKTQSAIGFYLAVFSNCVTVRGALLQHALTGFRFAGVNNKLSTISLLLC